MNPAPGPPTAPPTERGSPPREGWCRAANFVALAMGLALVVVALRPGTPLGPAVYGAGLPLLGTLALLLILVGLVVSARRPPVVRPARLRAFLILAATAFLAVLPIPYPSSHDAKPSAITFAVPVRGDWEVVLGGDDAFANTLVLSPQLRYAVSLSRPPGDPAAVPVMGSPVYAPAAGRVVEVEGGLPDAAPDGAPAPGTHRAGNRVVLEVATDEYLFLVGLEQGSPSVEVGETIERGRLLGRIGRSAQRARGSADHLLLHLQDRPEWGRGEGIPWRFGGFELLEGAEGGPVDRARLLPNQTLRVP